LAPKSILSHFRRASFFWQIYPEPLMWAEPPAGPASVAQVSLADFAPASEVAVFNVVDGATGSVDSLASGAPSAAGGSFAGRGRQHGHIVSWRVQGAHLELSEVSMVPEAHHYGLSAQTPDRAELSLRFPASLVPEVSIAQLADDSLLISAVTHAPSAGGHVYQLRFHRAQYAADGAPLERAFWLLRPEPVVLTKYGYADQTLGGKLGRLRLSRFDAPREEAEGVVSQLLVLGGESDAISLVEMRTDFAMREMETPECLVAGPKSRWGGWGWGGAAAASSQPAGGDALADLALVSSPHDAGVDGAAAGAPALCAVGLFDDGRLSAWQLQAAGTSGLPSAAPIAMQSPVPREGTSGAGTAERSPALAAWSSGSLVALALAHHSYLNVSVRTGLGNDVLRRAAEPFAAMSWRAIAAPSRARLLRLVLQQESGASGDLVLCALYGSVPATADAKGQPPSLHLATVPLADGEPVGAWRRASLLCDEDDEDDEGGGAMGLLRGQDAAAPLGSLTDRLLRRLMHPFRFTPRQLEHGCAALLSPPAPSEGARPLSARLERGLEQRLCELEASAAAEAAVSGRPAPGREESELALGSQFLSLCRSRKTEQAELLGMQPLVPNAAGSPLVLMTRSSLTMLLKLPGSDDGQQLVEAARGLARQCVPPGHHQRAWLRDLPTGTPLSQAAVEAAARQLRLAPAAALRNLPSITTEAAQALLRGLLFPESAEIAHDWHAGLLAGGGGGGDNSADTRLALAHCVAASAHALAARGAGLAADLLLLLLAVQAPPHLTAQVRGHVL